MDEALLPFLITGVATAIARNIKDANQLALVAAALAQVGDAVAVIAAARAIESARAAQNTNETGELIDIPPVAF